MPDIDATSRKINDMLPELARTVIRQHLDLRQPENRAFLEAPDAVHHHQAQWHQWGIITHTREFLHDLDTRVPDYLRRWGVWEEVDTALSARIDGATRWQLLHVTVLLHDIGKFGARTHGRHRFHFSHHEKLSGSIIRDELDLARFGLTPAQIAYVAQTAEDHFVLGLVRKRAREEGKYDVAYTRSKEFGRLALRIKSDHPSDYLEIGVLFLGDSLAKTNPGEGPEQAASQYQVNIDVAHRYLETVTR